MRHHLVAVEVEIDPSFTAAPFRTAEQATVELARFGDVADREGEVEQRGCGPGEGLLVGSDDADAEATRRSGTGDFAWHPGRARAVSIDWNRMQPLSTTGCRRLAFNHILGAESCDKYTEAPCKRLQCQ